MLFGLTLMILLTSGAILIATILGAFRASKDLAKEVIEEVGYLVTYEVSNYFSEVERSLKIASQWAINTDLNPDDEDRILSFMIPYIAESPRVSSIMFFDEEGTEFMLLQDPVNPDYWTLRFSDPEKYLDRVYFRRWIQGEGIISDSLEYLDYDARGRIYYEIAMDTEENTVDWTPPVVFFTTKDPGMTAIYRWRSSDEKIHAFAYDVLLLDLSRLTSKTKISENGIAYVLSLEEPHRIVGLPNMGGPLDNETIRNRLSGTNNVDKEADTAPELPIAGSSGISEIDAAVMEWDSLGSPDGSIPFELGGETWWAHFTRLEIGRNSFVTVAAAPQNDFVYGLNEAARRITIATLISVLISTIIAIRFARNYARPLEVLAKASRRIRNLDLSPQENITSSLIEINDLVTEQERTRIALDAFSRYMPVEIVRNLVASGVAAKVGGERREITILFTDIEGFTTISESRSAEAVTSLLMDYFEILMETIRKNGGEVNQLLGDGVVAYWGAPVYDDRHAYGAVKAIIECHERIIELNKRFISEGKPAVPTRFGVASGEVMIGNLGSKSRLAYAAVGDTANLASRIEGLNKFYGTRLLVAEETKTQAGDHFEWRHIDGVRVKGRVTGAELFEPLGLKGSVDLKVLSFRDKYEEALYAYRDKSFQKTLELLDEIDTVYKEHLSVKRLIEQSKKNILIPPPHNWDGMTDFYVK